MTKPARGLVREKKKSLWVKHKNDFNHRPEQVHDPKIKIFNRGILKLLPHLFRVIILYTRVWVTMVYCSAVLYILLCVCIMISSFRPPYYNNIILRIIWEDTITLYGNMWNIKNWKVLILLRSWKYNIIYYFIESRFLLFLSVVRTIKHRLQQ